VSEIVDKIQKASIRQLNQLVIEAIASCERQVVDSIGGFKALSEQSTEVLERFVVNLNQNFDKLMDREIIKNEEVFNFETLSLVQEEELDVIVALEGMVNASRNEHLAVFISFNTRLSSMFPRKRIDESSNPLDPDQVATAFQEALRPLGMDAQNTLSVYRAFNTCVLKELDKVIGEANKLLVQSNVIPNLGMESSGKTRPASRTRPRADASAFGTIEEEAFDEEVDDDQPELFSVMQNLLHSETPVEAPATNDPDTVAGQPQSVIPAEQQYMIPTAMVQAGTEPAQPGQASAPAVMQPFQPQEGQTVELVDQAKLMEILNNIQEKLNASGPHVIPESMDEVAKLDISQSLGAILQESQEDDSVVPAVDRQSSDIINLVTLLYEAIWQDPSVPIPIKELIGRTQVTIIKVALADVEFFNNENHPARAILNEFASAGIGWTEVEALEQDPLYQKIQELVEKLLSNFDTDNEFFERLIQDFRAFRTEEAAKTSQLEQRILKAGERKDRLDDIHELVTQKIDERILGRELHPFVEDLLKEHFHKFMVMLVLKEGPGGNAWKQAINTIDVLLWSVQPHEQEGDHDRLDTIKPRLLNNLRKALRIANSEPGEIETLIERLQSVQEETFLSKEAIAEEPEEDDSELRFDDSGVVEPKKETAKKETEEEEESEEDIVQTVRFLAAGEFDQSDQAESGRTDQTDKQDELAESEDADSDPSQVPTLSTEDSDLDNKVALTAEQSPKDIKAKKPDVAEKIVVEEDLANDDPYLKQVDNLSVGMWVEFAGEENANTRCKLAAKINAIDKYIFVNRQGVKVVEKNKMGLAKEVRDGTVSIISDGLLFSRALESVIGNLRDSQHQQQTGSAYQPSDTSD
jgi:hypothetical protein